MPPRHPSGSLAADRVTPEMKLSVVAGPDQGRSLELGKRFPGMVIGRRSDCDLVLGDPEVSGRHARQLGGF